MQEISRLLLTKVALKAKDLSVQKWQDIIDNDGKHPTRLSPDLAVLNDVFNDSCPYCVLFHRCSCCPLFMKGLSCSLEGHPWTTWRKDKTTANAQAVLDAINKVHVKQMVVRFKINLEYNKPLDVVPLNEVSYKQITRFIEAFKIKE